MSQKPYAVRVRIVDHINGGDGHTHTRDYLRPVSWKIGRDKFISWAVGDMLTTIGYLFRLDAGPGWIPYRVEVEEIATRDYIDPDLEVVGYSHGTLTQEGRWS